MKSYDHLNFSRASVVQFRASLYVMRLNRTSEWKVKAIWIAQDLPFVNFERVYMWCAWIGPLSEKSWPFEFLKSFRFSISGVSMYYAPESDLRVKSYDHLNFSRNLVCLDILCAWIGPPSEKLWPFELLNSFHCSISSVSIYYAPESDLLVESY